MMIVVVTEPQYFNIWDCRQVVFLRIAIILVFSFDRLVSVYHVGLFGSGALWRVCEGSESGNRLSCNQAQSRRKVLR